jgi:hypothetical protein
LSRITGPLLDRIDTHAEALQYRTLDRNLWRQAQRLPWIR